MDKKEQMEELLTGASVSLFVGVAHEALLASA
jgi:hypothetical protein